MCSIAVRGQVMVTPARGLFGHLGAPLVGDERAPQRLASSIRRISFKRESRSRELRAAWKARWSSAATALTPPSRCTVAATTARTVSAGVPARRWLPSPVTTDRRRRARRARSAALTHPRHQLSRWPSFRDRRLNAVSGCITAQRGQTLKPAVGVMAPTAVSWPTGGHESGVNVVAMLIRQPP